MSKVVDFLKNMLPTSKSDSPAHSVGKKDVSKVFRDAGIAGLIALLVSLSGDASVLTENLGEYAAGAAALLVMAISSAVRWLRGNSEDNGTKP